MNLGNLASIVSLGSLVYLVKKLALVVPHANVCGGPPPLVVTVLHSDGGGG